MEEAKHDDETQGATNLMHHEMDPRLVVRYAVREVLGLVVMGLALFGSAGRVDWWPAWAVLAVMAAWIIMTAIVIFQPLDFPAVNWPIGGWNSQSWAAA